MVTVPFVAECAPRWMPHEKTAATSVRLLSTLCAHVGNRVELLPHRRLVDVAMTKFPGNTQVLGCAGCDVCASPGFCKRFAWVVLMVFFFVCVFVCLFVCACVSFLCIEL
jgi:hypothetical protein